ncbi:Smr/MutS family protein [Roseomonas elaeocarpi]|uniref:Smr/MutS family protein n=1 Tax=Roseomonas elaeocarpi TaxID=907779 RepID=A0ABV6JPM3_9PROT
MARRPRTLSESERALWQAWARVNRVVSLTRAPPDKPAETPPAPKPEPAPAPATAVVARPAAPALRLPPPPISVGTPGPGLDARRWRDLRRGKLRPERTLDLHGRRAQDAHGAVLHFLAEAHADGLRCVAIVTGKGSGEGGVLRRELPHWLNLPALRPLLLGAAHSGPANTGAVHLLLRRRRGASDRGS